MAIEPWKIWSHTFFWNRAEALPDLFNSISIALGVRDAGNQVIAQVSGQRRSRCREEANVLE